MTTNQILTITEVVPPGVSITESLPGGATMDLVASVLPKGKRTMGVSMHSLVRRIPMALGPVLGGVMIGLFGEKSGVRLAFVAAMILGGVSLALQQVVIEDDKRRESKAEGNPVRALRFMSPALPTRFSFVSIITCWSTRDTPPRIKAPRNARRIPLFSPNTPIIAPPSTGPNAKCIC